MNDIEFLHHFEKCSLPKEQFKHRGHLRIAWLYLNRYSFNTAILCIRQGIQRYAASLNAEQIYHETMTLAWAALVASAMKESNADTFEGFINAHPALANSKLIHTFYTHEHLYSEAAKNSWLPPDLQSLPAGTDQSLSADH